jgi:polyisoprenoid-binding protein YceI
MRKLFLFALPLLISTPLIAQNGLTPSSPGAPDKSRVAAGNYVVESTHAQIQWTVNHFGFNDYFGIFGSPTGTMTLDPARPNNAKISIDIPISELVTSSAKLTEHMLRPGKDGKPADFFDITTHPSAKFVSTSVTATGTEAKIVGNLTFNGVTKPVTLSAKFTGAGTNPFNKKATVGFQASTTINRSDWGMKYGLPFVTDAVRLKISVAFEKSA